MEENEQKILSLIKYLVKRKFKLDGGNCGQFTLGLSRFLKDKFIIDTTLGLISNFDGDSDTELLGDVDIYHVFLEYNNKMFDVTGEIDDDDLGHLALNQYNNPDPVKWSKFKNTEELIRQIISINTAWDTEWTTFYKELEKFKYEKIREKINSVLYNS
jgi:hypothetical protein